MFFGVALDIQFEGLPQLVEFLVVIVDHVLHGAVGNVLHPLVVILRGILWIDGVGYAVWFEHGIEGLL